MRANAVHGNPRNPQRHARGSFAQSGGFPTAEDERGGRAPRLQELWSGLLPELIPRRGVLDGMAGMRDAAADMIDGCIHGSTGACGWSARSRTGGEHCGARDEGEQGWNLHRGLLYPTRERMPTPLRMPSAYFCVFCQWGGHDGRRYAETAKARPITMRKSERNWPRVNGPVSGMPASGSRNISPIMRTMA